MLNPNLHFNILTFDLPSEAQIFYFSLTETEKCRRLHRSAFPNDIEKIFPRITESSTEFIYTTFDYAREDFTPLDIDFKIENQNLIRKFYNRRINYFFKKEKEQIVRVGFIGQNQIWVKSKKFSDDKFTIFQKFSIKLQFNNVSNYPELIISYDGKSRMLNTNIEMLSRNVSPSHFKWVIKENNLYQYEDLIKHDEPDYDITYPVINFELEKDLGIEMLENKRENRYKNYKDLIDLFYSFYLNTEEFKKHIPIHDDGFLKVSEHLISFVDDASNNLAFQKPNVGKTPKKEFPYKKPYLKCQYPNVHLFFIYHKDDQHTKDKLQAYLENGLGHYRGLTNYAGILFHPDESMNICFENRYNPLPEIQQFFEPILFANSSIKYLAIYLTPFTKEETRRQETKIYVRVKELLLARNIACQFVEPETVEAPNEGFKWSLTTMSVAILAKLGGIPWQLATEIKNELIIGVGAFKHPDGVQYLSSAFSFNNTGHFNEFAYFLRHETDVMAGSIAFKIKEFAANYGNPSKLIIHFYKERMTMEEIAPVEAALKDLNLPNPIPVFIVHVNKTEAKDIIAYDNDWTDNWMPYSGTYISIGNKKYLLFNNSRYPGEAFAKTDGYPFPIKLSIDCTDEKQLNNEQTIKELINQVYQFSRMYFKSLAQQNLPVTVKYPEIIAELAPHMANADLPDSSKNTLWFL